MCRKNVALEAGVAWTAVRRARGKEGPRRRGRGSVTIPGSRTAAGLVPARREVLLQAGRVKRGVLSTLLLPGPCPQKGHVWRSQHLPGAFLISMIFLQLCF